jgi:CheY-like chemotaxis protein
MPTLLLADDSVTIQRVIELTFADEQIAVAAVGDGHAAIAALAHDPPPDVVLADIDMPGLDGYAVAQHVRESPRLQHIPVLLLTGAFDPVDEARAQEAGVAGVLVKPFEPQMVIAKVRELLGRPPREWPPLAHEVADAAAAVPDRAGEAQPSVDDYFERLDAAFASLNVPLEADVAARAGAASSTQPPNDGRADARPHVGPAASEPDPEPQPDRHPVSMADAFGALLGMERGEPAPPLGGVALVDASLDVAARQAAEQAAERIVRELVPGLVSEIAERLVREEIERLKALAQ